MRERNLQHVWAELVDVGALSLALRLLAAIGGLAVSALQGYWGIALTLWVQASSTPSYDVLERIADLDVQGVVFGVLALPMAWAHWRGGWAGVAASGAGVFSWSYVIATFAAANARTTALPTYSWIWALCAALMVVHGTFAPTPRRS